MAQTKEHLLLARQVGVPYIIVFDCLFIYKISKKHMSVKEQYWKYSLITIILGLGLILFIKMSPFMGGILGACTIRCV